MKFNTGGLNINPFLKKKLNYPLKSMAPYRQNTNIDNQCLLRSLESMGSEGEPKEKGKDFRGDQRR